MSKNILLVYPKYPETFWSFKHVLWFVRKKAAFPPLGLATVGAMLPDDWNPRLVDCNISEVTDEDLQWADMVFLSAMIVQADHARELIARAKSRGVTVVAGGPAFTTGHEKFDGVDHFVLGESEVTLPLFLDDLENGRPRRVYQSDERPAMSRTPVPRWDLVDMRAYATMPVQYSRGCPYNCEFCDIVIMNGRVPRTKSPGQVLAEMDALYSAGWRGSVFIVDDNFIGNRARVKTMLRRLVQWQKARRFPFLFLTEASTDLADDPELMRLMTSANFYKVFLGLETPSVESLTECGKHQNASRDLSQAVKTIHAHGMQVMGGFIVGFDNDTDSIFQAQINFIQRIGVVTAMVGMLSALPKTRLWRRLKDEGRLISESSGENTDGSTNFLPRMGMETLVNGYREILDTIYSPKNYYKRIHTFIRDYRPTARARLTLDDVRAFMKSTWRIGVFSRSSFRYWWLLAKTFATNARAVPVAVELAIFGVHFQKVAKRALGRDTANSA